VRFVTDPRQAREVVMKDGTKYPVSPGGSFVVTDARHLDEMDRGNHDVYSSAITFGGKGRECPCGFVGWRWQIVCPKCGRLLPE
jgi:hypothetical protein